MRRLTYPDIFSTSSDNFSMPVCEVSMRAISFAKSKPHSFFPFVYTPALRYNFPVLFSSPNPALSQTEKVIGHSLDIRACDHFKPFTTHAIYLYITFAMFIQILDDGHDSFWHTVLSQVCPQWWSTYAIELGFPEVDEIYHDWLLPRCYFFQ